MSLYHFVCISLREANDFIERFHRHSKRVRRNKFQVGLAYGDELIGVAVAAQPISRLLCDGKTVEIVRVCVKEGGHVNANSMLYARMIKLAKLMGFEKVLTYTLSHESQSTMKAIGAVLEAEVKPTTWNRPNRQRTEQEVYARPKLRWRLY